MWFGGKQLGTTWATWIAGLVLLVVPFRLTAATVTATLDRNSVPLGESVTFTLTFRGNAPNTAPALPPLDGLNLAGITTSSQFQMINGAVDSIRTYNYQLVPDREGTLNIPAMQVQVGNERLQTRPLALQVTARAANAGQPQQAFLKLILPRNTVHVGEAFDIEIHLYWNNARDIQTPQLKADGFSLIRGQNPPYQESQTTVNNVPYNLVIFKMAATPARSGTLEIGPATCNLSLLIPLPRTAPRDPFNTIFGSQFQRRPVELRSNVETMTVKPLPTRNVPESFSGAVGRFQLNVTASPTNLAVGDPITVRARISGQGYLDALVLPEQKRWREFKLYPPSDSVQATDPFGLSGTKQFEQVVIPQNHDVQVLPPLEFSYFDTAREDYVTLQSPAMPLTVSHARQNSSPFPSLTNTVSGAGPGTDDIVHIRPRLEGVMGWRTPWVFRPGFLLVQATPLAVWLGLVVARRRRESLARNPRLQRQREVARKVREGLDLMKRDVAAQAADSFHATLFRLLQEQLGERLDLPASAITEAVIEERLGGLPEPARDDLHDLFQACNQARYAPQSSSRELDDLLRRTEKVLSTLRQWNE